MKKQTVLFLSLSGLAAPLWAATTAIEPPMTTIPAGQFTMGSDQDLAASRRMLSDHKPAHPVRLKAFRLAKYEVTVKEFARFVAATNYKAPEKCVQMHSKRWFEDVPGGWQKHSTSSSDYQPVTCIGWDAAKAYVDWLAKETGKPYRLPSEAEWEYAARAGTTGSYAWGEDKTLACRHANVADRAAEAAIKRDYDGLESKNHVGVVPCDDGSGYASVVGMYEPNAFGLYDMIGNINEYVQDCYSDSYRGAPTDGSARLDGECKERVLRGGPWHWSAWQPVRRGAMEASYIGSLEGFRVAVSVDDPAKTMVGLSPSAFEKELANAQETLRAQRKNPR